jgi:hypothetical protein
MFILDISPHMAMLPIPSPARTTVLKPIFLQPKLVYNFVVALSHIPRINYNKNIVNITKYSKVFKSKCTEN